MKAQQEQSTALVCLTGEEHYNRQNLRAMTSILAEELLRIVHGAKYEINRITILTLKYLYKYHIKLFWVGYC